jgi:DNA-binding transcriptional LysR family regulator
MNNLSLNDFVLLTRLAEAKSFSAVARERNVAASLISRAVSRIEAECGLRLVNRDTHHLSMTDDGEIFLEYASRIISEHQQLQDSFSHRNKSATGVVRISISQLLAEHVVIPKMSGLHELHPDMTVELSLEDRVVSLAQEGVDIAVRGAVAPSEQVIARSLGQHGRVLYASQEYARKHGIPNHPSELMQHHLITNSLAVAHSHWLFKLDGKSHLIQAQGKIRVNSSAAVASLILSGAGIGLINDVIGQRLRVEAKLQPILHKYIVPGKHEIHAIVLAQRHRAPKIKAALGFLQSCFSDFQSGSK